MKRSVNWMAVWASALVVAGWAGPSVASMGYTSGLPIYDSTEDEDVLQRAQTSCGACNFDDPQGPAASFTATPDEGRFPLTVTLEDTSTPGSDALDCWYWSFGDGQNSSLQNPTHVFAPFRVYQVRLTVRDTKGRCSSVTLPINVQLAAPSLADQAYLAGLQENYQGLRSIISQHPTRNDFFIGLEQLEGVWYGAPMLWNPMAGDPCGAFHWLDRHWEVCTEGHEFEGEDCANTCTYCNQDPQSLTVPYGTLPLATPEIADYVQHEFGTLIVGNSLLHGVLARRALWNGASFDIDYSYDIIDTNFVARAQVLGMNMYAVGPIYWLPAWAAYGQAMGRITPENMRDILYDHVENVMTHFTQPDGPRFSYFSVAQEVLKFSEEAGSLSSLAQSLRWQTSFEIWPAAADTEVDSRLWWPWYILSKPTRTGSTPPYSWGYATDPQYAVDVLKQCYVLARQFNPEAKLTYDDHDIEFRYADGTTPQDSAKYQRAHLLIDEFQEDEIPLDGIALQMHITTWSCLTYDEGPNVLRLNPKQLQSLRDGARGFEEKGMEVILSQMDVRAGVPAIAADYLPEHLGTHDFAWTTLSVDERNYWQGEVYEAALNAVLAVPAVKGVGFWDISDELSWFNTSYGGGWPFTPAIPDEAASRAHLFGDFPSGTNEGEGEGEGEREMYYPKPAYWGVRNAITNYFGRAFAIRDAQDQEIARFVENGNVLLLTEGAHVVENVTDWSSLGLPSATGREFIVRDSLGNYEAIVTEEGVMYLAGVVMEQQAAPLAPASNGTAFMIRRNGEIVSMIDEAGNLRLRGYLLEDGVPFGLPKNDSDDRYYQQ